MAKIDKIEIEKPEIIKIEKPTMPKRSINVKLGKRQPDFETMLAPDEHNPLDDIDWTGEPEEDAMEEIGVALQHILDQKAAMKEKYRINLDPEYYFVVAFQCRDQKEQFLELTKWQLDGDKFINGLQLADELGLELTVYELDMKKGVPAPKKLRDIPKI